ncbi:MAG: hypothetical protein EAX95_03875 [Candidatus Thorarchaeota archaeon]|nr:hypothetical protein [Candidatus Thorarchaeota archaeon]
MKEERIDILNDEAYRSNALYAAQPLILMPRPDELDELDAIAQDYDFEKDNKPKLTIHMIKKRSSESADNIIRYAALTKWEKQWHYEAALLLHLGYLEGCIYALRKKVDIIKAPIYAGSCYTDLWFTHLITGDLKEARLKYAESLKHIQALHDVELFRMALLGSFDFHRRQLETLAEKDSQNPIYPYGIAQALAATGKDAKGEYIKAFERGVFIIPFVRSEFEIAERLALEALDLEMDLHMARYVLGLCQLQQENLESVLDAFRQCTSLDPSNSSYSHTLSLVEKLLMEENPNEIVQIRQRHLNETQKHLRESIKGQFQLLSDMPKEELRALGISLSDLMGRMLSAVTESKPAKKESKPAKKQSYPDYYG